jgi:hypothetical protein
MGVSEAGQFDGSICGEKNCFESDIPVCRVLLVEEV